VADALRPWRFVVAFGVVSLLTDMVYEGARSIIGPYLATLGASATLVGLVAGAAEFIGYSARVVTGYAVGRTGRYWTWTIAGYALTILSVPAIGLTGTLAVALATYAGERLGKAVRSPAKDTLLSFASTSTGRGSAFGVHQALDQTGAVLGPLLLTAVLAFRQDDYRLAFAVLLVPGLVALALLLWLRHRVPDPQVFEAVPAATASAAASGRLPAVFWRYAALVALLSCGVAPFPLLAYSALKSASFTQPAIPLLFATAMAVDGLSGLVVGRWYDRHGPRTLLLVPVAAAASSIAFSAHAPVVWLGVAVWGLVAGVLDSTVKAVVTELVPREQRALGFGWLSLFRGVGLLVAGVGLGAAYEVSRGLVAAIVVATGAAALLGLQRLLRTGARIG
jgi:MFS family permease